MNNLVKSNNNLISSREIANDLGKLHKHVLRDIKRQIDKANPLFIDKNNEPKLAPVKYTDAKGEQRPEYQLTIKAPTQPISAYIKPLDNRLSLRAQ